MKKNSPLYKDKMKKINITKQIQFKTTTSKLFSTYIYKMTKKC